MRHTVRERSHLHANDGTVYACEMEFWVFFTGGGNVKWYFPHFNYNALIGSTFCLSFIRRVLYVCECFIFGNETNAWVLCQVNVKLLTFQCCLSIQASIQSKVLRKRLTHVNLITFLYVCAYNRFPFCLEHHSTEHAKMKIIKKIGSFYLDRIISIHQYTNWQIHKHVLTHSHRYKSGNPFNFLTTSQSRSSVFIGEHV